MTQLAVFERDGNVCALIEIDVEGRGELLLGKPHFHRGTAAGNLDRLQLLGEAVELLGVRVTVKHGLAVDADDHMIAGKAVGEINPHIGQERLLRLPPSAAGRRLAD